MSHSCHSLIIGTSWNEVNPCTCEWWSNFQIRRLKGQYYCEPKCKNRFFRAIRLWKKRAVHNYYHLRLYPWHVISQRLFCHLKLTKRQTRLTFMIFFPKYLQTGFLSPSPPSTFLWHFCHFQTTFFHISPSSNLTNQKVWIISTFIHSLVLKLHTDAARLLPKERASCQQQQGFLV